MIDSSASNSHSHPAGPGSGKTWLLGVSSMLGWSIARCARPQGIELFCNQHTRIPRGAPWRRLNLESREHIQHLIARERPELIIHCAGICDVDKCQAAPDFAHQVNVAALDTLLGCVPARARIVYLSSDHVFSGDSGPYTESSVPDPISVYGRTRMQAETMLLARHERALVVRAGLWVGPSHNGRIGHLDWLRYRHARGLPMTVIADEHRSAVWAEAAAERVLALAASELTGVRHVVASRIASRPELAEFLNRTLAIGARLGVKRRSELERPHIGKIDLRTEYSDALATPLPPVVGPESPAKMAIVRVPPS